MALRSPVQARAATSCSRGVRGWGPRPDSAGVRAPSHPAARALPAYRAALRRWRALLAVGLFRGLAAILPFLLLYFPPHYGST